MNPEAQADPQKNGRIISRITGLIAGQCLTTALTKRSGSSVLGAIMS